MKKHSKFLITTLALFGVLACTDDDGQEESLAQEITDIRVVASDFVPEGPDARLGVDLARGYHVHWTANDTIGILPDVGAQVPFPLQVKEGEQQQSITFTGGGWALKPSTAYAAYFPYVGNIGLDKSAIPLDFRGQWQRANGAGDHLSPFVYMASVATTPENGSVKFKFQHLACLVWLEVVTPEPMAWASLELIVDQPLLVHEALLDLTSPTLALKNIVVSDTMTFSLEGVATTEENSKASMYFIFAPTNLEQHTVRAVLRDMDGYTEEVQFAGKNMLAGKAYQFRNLQLVTYPKVAVPHWRFDEVSNSFQAGMTAVVTVPRSMKKFMGEGDELAAFIDDELRGVGKRIGDAYYLVVHGNIGEASKVTFQYFNQKKEYMYVAKDVVDFNSDKVYGTADHPKELPLQLQK